MHGDHGVVGNDRPMDLRRARFEKGRRWKTVPVGQKSLMKKVEDITAGAVTLTMHKFEQESTETTERFSLC